MYTAPRLKLQFESANGLQIILTFKIKQVIIYKQTKKKSKLNIGVSSNLVRTAIFGVAYLGSNPSTPTNLIHNGKVIRFDS